MADRGENLGLNCRWTSPRSPPARGRRTSRSPRCSSHGSSARTCGPCTASPARRHARRRDRRRPARCARRARARGRRLLRRRAPTWPVMRELQPTIRAFALPREPFLRLIECNRQDQRIAEYETWADLEAYCTLSADPVGRLVLGVLGRAGDRELVARVATTSAPGSSSSTSSRTCRATSRSGASTCPRRTGGASASPARPPNEPLAALLAFEAERARGLLAAGERLRGDRRPRRPRRRAVRPRRPGGARGARATPAGTSSRSVRGRRGPGSREAVAALVR